MKRLRIVRVDDYGLVKGLRRQLTQRRNRKVLGQDRSEKWALGGRVGEALVKKIRNVEVRSERGGGGAKYFGTVSGPLELKK